jgi:hypothetical protein
MSQDRFVFESVDFQNGANTINNYVTTFNAQNNAAVTGNTFKFRSDYDRMKNLIGSSGQSRTSGYYDGLYATYYNITVNPPTLPSINGPGGSGWGEQLASSPFLNTISITDSLLQTKVNKVDNVGVQISGYLYSPIASTVTFQVVSDDGVAIYLNGALVTPVDAWDYQGPTTYTTNAIPIAAGYTPIRILYFEGQGGSVFQFIYRLASGVFTGVLPCTFFYNYNQM